MIYAIIAVCAVLILFVATLVTVFMLAFYSPYTKAQFDPDMVPTGKGYDEYRDTMHGMIAELAAYHSEEVAILSYDGLVLVGKYIHVADGAPLDIMIHGYRGLALRDFSGGAVFRLKKGHNVLLCEQRAHERSGGHVITFGIKEHFDVVSWVDYAVKRFGNDVEIALFGVSMGAATVLMASELDLPPQVKAICADCPYTSPKDIIKNTIKQIRLPAWLFVPLLNLSAHLFGGFGLDDASAERAVKNAKVPILLMHGTADSFVPCEMSRRIAAANPDKVELHLWEGASHGMSFVVHTQEYIDIENKFFERVERLSE